MKIISLRVSDDDYAYLQRRCDISGYLRELIKRDRIASEKRAGKVMVIDNARKDREEPHGSGSRNRVAKEHAEQ